VPTEAELARAEGRSYESADQLLQRILQERRAKWELEQLADMKAKGKTPKDDRWKSKYSEPVQPDTSELSELPEGWEWVRYMDIATAVDPNPSHRMPKYIQDGVPFVSTENFRRDGTIDFSVGKTVSQDTLREQIKRFEIPEGAFALTRIGTIGKTCPLPTERNYCLSHALCVLAPISEDINSKYLRLLVSSDVVINQARSGTQSIGVPDLGIGVIRSFLLPLPPLDEQHRIVAEVERRLSVIDELEVTIATNLKRADRLRQAILKRAFEGKLVPQDPTDEPASVLLERIRLERERATEKPKTTPQQTKAPQPMVQAKSATPVQGELALGFHE